MRASLGPLPCSHSSGALIFFLFMLYPQKLRDLLGTVEESERELLSSEFFFLVLCVLMARDRGRMV